MKVTLRQAHKLVDKITARLATIQLSATKTISIWDVKEDDSILNNEDILTVSAALLLDTINRHMKLITAKQLIRNLIRSANAVEIDGLVAQRKGILDITATNRWLLSTCESGAITTLSALQQKANALRLAAAGTSYGSDTVTICLIDESMQLSLDANIQQFQLQVEQIEDKLTTANATTSISIPVVSLQILLDEGIIAT